MTENVYAIVGPLGQRSQENDGLNANYEQMIHRADVALYASKAGGRKSVTPYAPGLEGKP